MFCESCGAKLPEGSAFCEFCGARVQAAEEPFPQTGPAFAPPPPAAPVFGFAAPVFAAPPEPPEAPVEAAFARTRTMSEAVELAAARNAEGRWAYWDSPDALCEREKHLRRFAQKEDKRLHGDPEGVLYYAVSPRGSVGHVFRDAYEGRGEVLEWVYFAPGEGERTLPAAPEQL